MSYYLIFITLITSYRISIVSVQNFHIANLKLTTWNFPTDMGTKLCAFLFVLAVLPAALELTRMLRYVDRNTYGFHFLKMKAWSFECYMFGAVRH